MEIKKVVGIVVSENPYKESSKLLNIVTEDLGLISVIAKGAKGLKSKLRSVTTKLTYAEFQIYYKEGKLSTLVCADVINPLINIKSDLLKISYTSFITELSMQVMKQTTDKNIFNLLVESLLKIEDGYDPIIITNILELKYLSYLGIMPNLNSCSVCGKDKILTVSTEKGGFVCNNCHTNEKIVNPKTLKILRMLYYVDISKISKIEVKDEIKNEIDEFINEYYDRYTGLYLKNKKFLKNVKNSYI